jgi:hypothetical protein
MPAIIILAVIIIAERLTGKTALELVTWFLKKAWAVIEWIILFLAGMNEPRGKKT